MMTIELRTLLDRLSTREDAESLAACEYLKCYDNNLTVGVPDSEGYLSQIAGIRCAALGYWQEGDPIHPSYDTIALHDVAALYRKYDGLYKAIQSALVELSQKGMGLPPSVTRAKTILQAAIDPFKDHEQKQETTQEVRAQDQSSEPPEVRAGGCEANGQGSGIQNPIDQPPSDACADTWSGD